MNKDLELPKPTGFTVRLLATGSDTAAVVAAWKLLSHWNNKDTIRMFEDVPINLMRELSAEQAAEIKLALENAGASVGIMPTV